jgi:spore coat polysaccharide biosynthesis protein SpsF
MNTVCILQARMGSTRLPGKVLLPIHGKSILQHVVDRIRGASSIDEIIVATTTNSEDDATERACDAMGVRCFRGSDWDVLDRYYQTALSCEPRPDIVVRICADNPTHHREVVDFTVQRLLQLGLDYFSNGNQAPSYFEDGITSEVFRMHALEEAWKHAAMMSEREHVTPYIKLSGKFKCGWQKFDDHYQYKLSVDTPEDFAITERVFQELGDDFTIQELITYMDRHPEITAVFTTDKFNQGYKKSIHEDKRVC